MSHGQLKVGTAYLVVGTYKKKHGNHEALSGVTVEAFREVTLQVG